MWYPRARNTWLGVNSSHRRQEGIGLCVDNSQNRRVEVFDAIDGNTHAINAKYDSNLLLTTKQQ